MRLSYNTHSEEWIIQNKLPAVMLTNLMRSKYIKELEQDAPSYEELRDMFSEGQMASKIWLAYTLSSLTEDAFHLEHCAIVGSWYGTLAALLQGEEALENMRYTLVDIDPRCQRTLDLVEPFPQPGLVDPITEDMYKFDYENCDIVINTSVEHIPNLEDWLSLIHDNTLVVLQSNDFVDGTDHINCHATADELADAAKDAGMRDFLFQGTLHCNAYNRHMVIGIR